MRADRLLSMMMLLQTRGRLTAQALANELGVSRRTILRDVDALSIAGVPVYTDGGHGGGISLDENYRTTLTGLNETEVRALFIAENNQFLSDLGLGEAARRIQQKLSAALPPTQHSLVDQVRQRLYIDPTWWWQDDQPLPFWPELEKAVFEDRRIRVEYENFSGESARRILEPYSLVAKASHWYLIAKRSSAFRLYRVTRFHAVQLLDTHFQRDAGFDLVTFWHAQVETFRESLAEYTFTLQVHPDRLNFVQSLAPGRSQILETDPRTGWLKLRIQMESVELAKMLVFGLGADGFVVTPTELRAMVQSDARTLLDGLDK